MALKMNILISAPGTKPYGQDLCSILAKELQNRGHNITVLQYAESPKADYVNEIKTELTLRSVDQYIDSKVIGENYKWPWFTSYGRSAFNWIFYHRWRRAIRAEIESHEYDVVISAYICTTPTTLGAIDAGVPSVIATTGPAALKHDSMNSKLDKTPTFVDLPWGKRVQYPFIKLLHKWNQRAFLNASSIISTNEFDANVVAETFGRRPEINYIPVKIDDYVADGWNPSKLTLINPRDKHKGLDMFLEIARSFPAEEFQIAGTLYDASKTDEIVQLENVEYLGWCDDMQSVYANTKLLIIPSTYQEGGPRIIAEAFANGIPAIGSDLGGIPDYIGDGGDVVENYTDLIAWRETVNQYISDKNYYDNKSEKAKQRSRCFDHTSQINSFEQILLSTVKNNTSIS
jgi:glycosyltransferase involved in cell wall biosynthesis